jgi:hypothetical protein
MPGMNYWSLHFKDRARHGEEVQKRLIQADDELSARKLANEYVGKQTGYHFSGPKAGFAIGEIIHLSPYEART